MEKQTIKITKSKLTEMVKKALNEEKAKIQKLQESKNLIKEDAVGLGALIGVAIAGGAMLSVSTQAKIGELQDKMAKGQLTPKDQTLLNKILLAIGNKINKPSTPQQPTI